MEETQFSDRPQIQQHRLEFFGKGSDFFGIMIVNWILTLITFGIYYPWARARRLNYIYGQTAFNNERFYFSGTGNEMFRGFIKLILFMVAAVVISFGFMSFLEMPVLSVLFFYGIILAIIPFAIHGSFRYRMSRTSLRGIRFGYRGDRSELTGLFFKEFFLTIITLGIYGAWFQMAIRRYTHSNIRYGDAEFSNQSSGSEWFFLNLKGYVLTVITLGIYLFWWQRDIFEFYFNNLRIKRGNQELKFFSTATGGGFFSLLIVNLLIVIFTLGLGAPWAEMRVIKFMCDHIQMEGDLDFSDIHQTEEEYLNAFGEDAMDFFEIDLT